MWLDPTLAPYFAKGLCLKDYRGVIELLYNLSIRIKDVKYVYMYINANIYYDHD